MDPPQKLIAKKKKAIADGNRLSFAVACNGMASYFNDKGLYGKALKEFQTEAKVYEELEMRMKFGVANRMIGEMYMNLDELEKALKHENLYLKISLEEDDKIEIQRAYATLGRAYLLKAQNDLNADQDSTKTLKNAEKAFIKSLLVCKELIGKANNLELQDMKARLYLNLSVAKENSDDLDKSLEYMTKAIAICKNSDLFELLHQCYMSTGLLYNSKMNDTTNALRYLNLAFDVAERLENRVYKCGQTLIAKGEVLIKLGDYQSAKQVLHKAYKLKTPNVNDRETIEQSLRVVAAICNTEDKLIIAESRDYKFKKDLYEKMGDGSCKLMNFQKAISYYKKMLENAQLANERGKDLIPIYVSLYQTYKDMKSYDLALEYMWKEYELCKDDPEESFNTLVNIADVNDLAGKEFWDTENILQRARNCVIGLKKLDLLEIIYIKLLCLQEKHGMTHQFEALEQEIRLSEIDWESIQKKIHVAKKESAEGPEDAEDTPNIGDEICLGDLSDSGSDDETVLNESDSRRSVRKRNVTVNKIKRNNKGETQLHQACISGNVALVKRLLEQGHPTNVRDNAGWLPLHEACNHGFKEIVELLLKSNGTAVINDKGGTTCDGITPIHDACSNGHLEIVELLLNKGANATLRTDTGETPLSCLLIWRKSVELNTIEEIFYNTIKSRLTDLMAKVGIPTDVGPKKQQLVSSRRASNKENSYVKTRPSTLLVSSSDECSDGLMDEVPQQIIKKSTNNEATDMYKKTMENLRHKSNAEVLGKSVAEEKKPAYLDSEEIDDDWLEDDIQLPDKKRRKYMPELPTSPKRNKEMSFDGNTIEAIPESDNSNSVDAFDIIMQNQPKQKSRKTSIRSLSLKSSSKNQQSLFEAGFTRRSDEYLNQIPDASSLEFNLLTSPVKSNRSSSIGNYSVSSVGSSMLTIKVKIEDQLIVVPVKNAEVNNLNLKWLSENAAKRFQNIHGRLPDLLLSTTDGALFDENDPLAIIVDIKPYVSTKVLGWATYSLLDSYTDCCKVMKQPKSDLIASRLPTADESLILDLKDLNLFSPSVEPLFKSVQHHKTLRSVDLSNNCIEDQGVTFLCQALPSLPQLKILNLSGNLITVDGIMKLENMFNNPRVKLSELSELNLSFNPIGDESVLYLSLICNNLPKLSDLKLASCNLTTFGDNNLCFDQLTALDISFNSFYNLIPIWLHLKVDKVKSLDLGFAVSQNYTTFGKDLAAALRNPRGCAKLEKLNLSSSFLSDSDLWEILQLIKTTNISYLELVQNLNLTFISFRYLINSNLHLKVLNLIGCENLLTGFQGEGLLDACTINLPENVNVHLQTDLETMEMILGHLKSIWNRHWGLRGKVLIKNSQIRLYVE